MTSLLKAGAAVAAALVLVACGKDKAPAAAPSAKPVLTVSTITPLKDKRAVELSASGDIVAKDVAIVAAEVGGLRVSKLTADIGDLVKKGQPLVTLNAEAIAIDLAAAKAALAEANATLKQAEANLERAKKLNAANANSSQDLLQAVTAAATARAKVDTSKAKVAAESLRLKNSVIEAPSDGVVLSKAVALGQVVANGAEVFKLAVDGTWEWKAEVAAASLALIEAKQKAVVMLPGGTSVEGAVRLVSPEVDSKSRTGSVLITLNADDNVKPGMFASGKIQVSEKDMLVLPGSAVTYREGKAYTFVVAPDNKLKRLELTTGNRDANTVAVVDGLGDEAETLKVVKAAGSFLKDGDLVKVVPSLGESE